jgi:hypothetical protein
LAAIPQNDPIYRREFIKTELF